MISAELRKGLLVALGDDVRVREIIEILEDPSHDLDQSLNTSSSPTFGGLTLVASGATSERLVIDPSIDSIFKIFAGNINQVEIKKTGDIILRDGGEEDKILLSAEVSDNYLNPDGNIGVGFDTAPSAKFEIRGGGGSIFKAVDSTGVFTRFEVANTGAITGSHISTTNSTLGLVHLGFQAGENAPTFPSLNVYVGALAGKDASGTSNLALGFKAYKDSVGNANTALGGNSLKNYTGGNSVGISSNAGNAVTGEANVFIGQSAGDFTDTAENVSNHLITGSNDFPLNDIYFGSGIAAGTVADYIIHGGGALGTNIEGGAVTIAGGQGTGSGGGGDITFATAPAGAGGAVKNALVSMATLDAETGDFDLLTGKYKAGGTEGVASFSGAVTSITIKNGIVTDIS